eukprot:TRINITY_DN14729_c0_g1_i1.p1 TRINITY_DN14729_c0_g1~~TRINITY_DN14729_c0_g1_i1.p1  ORF type:complete len:252 (-),score=78.96 TRINITY_DN14729_c0_g1_i1:84-746(-)
MADAMKRVAKLETELSVEERNLLSVAYKNVVGSRRSSLRIINSIQQKEESRGKQDNLQKAKSYHAVVEQELENICNEVLEVLEKHLIPSSVALESKVFYYKMKGDYHRYLAESSSGDKKQAAGEKAKESYQAATEHTSSLPTTNPIRLGLALNFSVFYYEILDQPKQAIELASKAFDNAIDELEQLPEETYKDSTLIMQLLRDNITLWTSNEDDKKDNDE